MITIDGSMGEGGGQVLRTALAMSMLTGKAFAIERIRANRQNPGLQRQHLTSVSAAKAVCGAQIEGAELGATALSFTPGLIRPGDYNFDVGSAGSTTLVLQTILPALLTAGGPSSVTLVGGTHNPMAPPLDFLQKAFLPLVGRMGPGVSVWLEEAGFYPEGGGRFLATVNPARPMRPIHLRERGAIRRRTCTAIVANLSGLIAERELAVLRAGLGWEDECFRVGSIPAGRKQGNVVLVEVESEHVTEVFTGFGQRGVPAEEVAQGVLKEVRMYLDSGVAVGEHLADQLMLPMVMAGGGTMLTGELSAHARTNMEVIRTFATCTMALRQVAQEQVLVEIARP